MRVPTENGRRIARRVLTAMIVLAAVLVALIPPDQQLGASLKLVLYHGASTWTSLALITVALVVGVAYLATRNEALAVWERALRLVNVVLWAINTVLGIVAMKLVWGGFLWSEPRLRMTFWILIALGVGLLLDLLFERRWLSAAVDVALGVTMWALVVFTPELFHPDNPVLNSDSWSIKGLFFALAATLLVAAASVVALVAVRVGTPAEANGPAAGDGLAAEGESR